MPTLADLQRAGAIQQQVRTRNLQNSRELIESISPYITFTDVEGTEYGGLSEDNFNKLYEKEPDKILKILNSSPTATTYTDIETGEKAKGKIIGVREQGGKITFDIQGKQGIVPKTLGFSNDPKDIVMATDREGLRTMVNAIVQGSSNRLTAAQLGYGSRSQAVTTNQVVRQNLANQRLKKLEEAESAPEAIGILEDQVEAGVIPPHQAFALITQIATDFNNGLDELRTKQGKELTALDSQIEDLTKQSTPGTESVRMSGGGMDSKVPVLKQKQPSEANIQATKELEVAKAKRQDLLTRIGQSNVTMPIYAGPEQILSFIEQNAGLLESVGVDQENVDKAKAALFKYNVQKPEDLKKLPDYDDELDINKVELASALAVAAGGNFQDEFQTSLNLLETGNTGVNRLQEQTFNRQSQLFNEQLKIDAEKNRIEARKIASETKNEAVKDAYEAFDKDFVNFTEALYDNDGKGGIADITTNKANIHFKRMIDKFSNAQANGTVSKPMIDGMRTVIGQAMYSVMMNRGVDDRGFFVKLFTDRGILDQTLGDIVNTARGIYEEKPGGGLQLKKIIFVDSSNRQVGKAIEGKEFTDVFNDLATNVEVSQFIKPYRGD